MIVLLSLLIVLAVCLAMSLAFGQMFLAFGILVAMLILLFFVGKPKRPKYGGQFEDTPEAWKARSVVPGETREQARQRLQQYRK